jgi:hypothetical protein
LNGGQNLYEYARADPVDHTDPTGFDTVVIITRDYGVGTHAALYIDNAGSPILFDPGGSDEPNGEPRGSGGFFEDSDANLQNYIDYQKSTESAVETYRFQTTTEQEAALVERISPSDAGPGEGEGGFFTCAYHVSRVLQGIGPFRDLDTYRLPGSLADALTEILSPTPTMDDRLDPRLDPRFIPLPFR